MKRYIRPIAIAIIRNNGRILVFKGNGTYDEEFYRPLGGGIEFGEKAYDALQREFLEELGEALINIEFVKVVENIFSYEGRKGHEVVFLFNAAFKNSSVYDQPYLMGKEDDGSLFKAYWMPIEDFKSGKAILYPTELTEIL